VRWENGWPTILRGDAAVPYVHRRPTLPAQPAPAIPTHGNFTVREELDGPELPPHWLAIRTPRERWHDFTSSPGALTAWRMSPSPETIPGVWLTQPGSIRRPWRRAIQSTSAPAQLPVSA